MINLKTKDWEINNIDTVLFDKDGTFIDLHYFWGKMTELRAQEIIKQFSIDSNTFEELCIFLGYDIKSKKMKKDGITALYSRQKIIEIFKKDLEKFSNEFYKDIHKYTKPIDSAIDFIKELKKRKVQLGIVTSDSVESTKITLKQFHWEQLFEVVIGRESSPHTKESGEPTKLALSQLKANPKTTIMIGDAPMDYISATNAGIEKTILVATGQIEKKQLNSTTKYAVNCLDELFIF